MLPQLFFPQFSTDSDIGFFPVLNAAKFCPGKVYFPKLGSDFGGLGGRAVDILQLRPLTVFPILDEFPMSILQYPLFDS